MPPQAVLYRHRSVSRPMFVVVKGLVFMVPVLWLVLKPAGRITMNAAISELHAPKPKE